MIDVAQAVTNQAFAMSQLCNLGKKTCEIQTLET